LTGARVVATGAYLPGRPISNADIERLVGPLPEEVLSGLGVEQRYWMVDPETGSHLDSNSKMAAEAVRQALDTAGWQPHDLDLLVVSTSSPDFMLPPMVTLVQDHLGLERCATLEIRSGCAGAVQGLDVARAYLERGLFKTAAVIGSEVSSPLLVPAFLGRSPDAIRLRDRLPIYAFGDGAGAVLLQAVSDAGDFAGFATACTGGGRSPGLQVVGGGTHAPLLEQRKKERPVELKLDAIATAELTPALLTEALADLLHAAGWEARSVDVCVIPEGNAGYLVDEIRASGKGTGEWDSMRGRIVENLRLVGATGSAAVPLALDHAWRQGALQPGARVAVIGLESSKWIYAGLAIRWSAGPP
jgi:3-oxoacyl-[acyl-carrier-protein] synthase-3